MVLATERLFSRPGRRLLSGVLAVGVGGWGLPAFTEETLTTPEIPEPSAPIQEPRAEVQPSFTPLRRKSAPASVAPLAAPKISLQSPARETPQGKNQYVDPSSFVRTAPQRLEVESAVVFSERRSRPAAESRPAPALAPRAQRLARRPSVSPRSLIARAPQSFSPLKPLALGTHRYRPSALRTDDGPAGEVFSLAPMAQRGIRIALAPLPDYSRSTRLRQTTLDPAPSQNTDLRFPIAQAAPISSDFGWRIHPISGVGRMHQGTDIAAPLGAPVVAAYSGQVALADWSGGYGLMVTIRHLDGVQESRYAHLSEIFVQPGQEVRQGEIIGRVGSTGYSTGPHLHFEWRHLTPQGWVAVDAGPHLQMALANLVEEQTVAERPQIAAQATR
ncbi:MAG: peptidoglycan DD-metalloendopeptidase family protein [Cyanobacteria bacterium RI_101]|nr:peptidoglycan DD-metalloendopeptidase family protein [Cyanobacteria bacterium RI_101]